MWISFYSYQCPTIYRHSALDRSWSVSKVTEREYIYESHLEMKRAPNGDIWTLGFRGELSVYRNDAWQTVSRLDTGGRLFIAANGSLFMTISRPCWHESVCSYGMRHYDGAKWTSLSTGDGDLVTDYVNDIAVDPDGDLWIATCLGLQRIKAEG